jgi:hypothetical protein
VPSKLEVAYQDPGGVGYHPVLYMVRLAGRLLGAEPIILHPERVGRVAKVLALLPRRRSGGACLLICRSPSELASLSQIEAWRQRFGRVIAWVFDSFWVDHIPRFARLARHFDHVFVTEQEDLDRWRRRLRAPVDWLPWGSDVLGLGSFNPARSFDLVRVGRQPTEWEDDGVSARACQARGLVFGGRPEKRDDAEDNERLLMGHFADTKFTLSFSNAASPAAYTHHSREYITARWTDALASGAIVAGIAPRSDTARALLWPEATLELGSVALESGLDVLAPAVRAWTAARAHLNCSMALERLDWRWRFEKLSDALGVDAPALRADLAVMRRRIDDRRRQEENPPG